MRSGFELCILVVSASRRSRPLLTFSTRDLQQFGVNGSGDSGYAIVRGEVVHVDHDERPRQLLPEDVEAEEPQAQGAAPPPPQHTPRRTWGQPQPVTFGQAGPAPWTQGPRPVYGGPGPGYPGPLQYDQYGQPMVPRDQWGNPVQYPGQYPDQYGGYQQQQYNPYAPQPYYGQQQQSPYGPPTYSPMASPGGPAPGPRPQPPAVARDCAAAPALPALHLRQGSGRHGPAPRHRLGPAQRGQQGHAGLPPLTGGVLHL